MQTPEHLYQALERTVRQHHRNADTDLLRLAFEFSRDAHAGQKRKTGEEYIYHSLATAQTLADMRLSPEIIIAGLLHDVPEDTKRTLEDIRHEFGDDVANMVDGITKLGTIKYRGIERYIENLRRMFVAMASDLRVVLIKFADRLHNLTTLYALPRAKQLRIASEVLEIYAPIANRLGMYEMKGRLEAEAFKYVQPKEYNWAKQVMDKQVAATERSLQREIGDIKRVLDEERIEYIDVKGRLKQLYGLYKKLLRHDRDINRVYDFMAVRVIVRDIPMCYAALGAIHKHFKPLKGRFKDYIAQPKPNGYASLHTTVFGADQHIFEVQIRTVEMEEESEFGVAAHWYYHEGRPDAQRRGKFDWIQELTKWQKELTQNQNYLERLKLDVLRDRIFVFTPKGDVIDLPAEATVIDFAYHVHTQIGNSCTGARVNNQIASLDKALKSGDVVEIITDKHRTKPNPDWAKFAKTANARSKIRAALSKQSLLEKFWSK